VGPLHDVHRSGGEWCCAAAVTHMYTHIYTYMLTAHGVYVVRYPTLLEWTSCPQADQAIERGRVFGLREERGGIERLVPVGYYCPAKSPVSL